MFANVSYSPISFDSSSGNFSQYSLVRTFFLFLLGHMNFVFLSFIIEQYIT